MINLNPFLALSRTPHLVLDLATPGLAALLCLGAFPPAPVLFLGLVTAFAGYTAVYALNDIIDYRIDVGGEEIRVQKGRRAPGPREREPCGIVFLKPHWYRPEE